MRKNIFPSLTTTTQLRINLAAIQHNYTLLKKQFMGEELAAVVKANAYGLGAQQVSQSLASIGCCHFFVATLDEGMKLRAHLPDHQYKIYVLNGMPPYSEKIFYEWRLTPVLNTYDQVKTWANLCTELDKKLPCNIHLDTGLNRLGLDEKNIRFLSQNPKILEDIDLQYWMTHLACSDQENHPMNTEQKERFMQHLAKLPKAKASLTASDGMLISPDFHFDMGRAGVALYGVNPHPNSKRNLKDVVELYAQILQVRDVKPEESVGYTASYTTKNPRKVAVVSCGYADGYFRSASNKAAMYINEHRCPVIGKISMDLTTIDVTDVPENLLHPGRAVEVFGRNNSLNDFANNAETIAYEVLTAISQRAQRIYS